jgi:hypothetical protein
MTIRRLALAARCNGDRARNSRTGGPIAAGRHRGLGRSPARLVMRRPRA